MICKASEIGGGLLEPETYQTADKKLVGSVLIYEADNLETVRKIVEDDVYYRSNVVCRIHYIG